MESIEQLLVRDVLPPNRTVTPPISQDLTVEEVALLFSTQRLEYAFVSDKDGRVIGRITLKILFHEMTSGHRNRLIADVIERAFPSVFSSDCITKCLAYFAQGDKAIAVLNNDSSLSQILRIDDVRALLQKKLECLTVDIDRLPLRDLDPSILLKILKNLADDKHVRFLVTDECGNIKFFNHAYEELTGISREEAAGKHVLEIFPQSRIPRILETGEPETRYYKSSLRYCQMLCTG